MSSKSPSARGASAMVRDLLGRIGAPTAAPAGGGPAAEVEASEPAAPADTGAASLARENARAALRRAQGLPPLPPSIPPIPAGDPANGGRTPPLVPPPTAPQGLATGRNRSAPAASGRPWRSEVAARIVAQRARGRCECDGACGGTCGAGPQRCAVRQGDSIGGPRDFPAERRVAVLLCEPTPSASWRGTIVESELTVRCTECSERFAARALRASAPVRAGGRGGRAAASGRGASAGGDDADVFAD